MHIKLYKILQNKYQSKDLGVFLSEVASQSLVNYILARKDSYYRNFKVKKKNGTYRYINEPLNQLFTIQKEFSHFFLINRANNYHSHGFELNKSIITNADKHTNKKIVLNIDLEDFFSNISTPRISKLLLDKFNVSELEAIKIANLLTYKNSLPQGSPSSPILSNLICEQLDDELDKYCKQFNITYTRYADDMSFSFNFNKLPIIQVKNIIFIIEQNNFKINKKKYRYYYRNARQLVTGLVVNEKINVKREYYKKLRAILHNWSAKGLVYAQDKFIEKYGENKNFILTVEGWVNFLGQVKGNNNPQFLTIKSQLDKLLQESQFVKTFNFNNAKPINLLELKAILEIPTLNFNTIKNEQGSDTIFMKHWDGKRRVAIVLKKDLVTKLKVDMGLEIVVEETIRKGKEGEYLMILVKEYNKRVII
jgi:RNA-directed DNA polymerase